mmetsp:Transcript_19095/g.40114  ORF Transcript_19095/g.40114 Transcript_19095/m.40114 type:complete len:534 (+) Transcript_19095:115-1716(+)
MMQLFYLIFLSLEMVFPELVDGFSHQIIFAEKCQYECSRFHGPFKLSKQTMLRRNAFGGRSIDASKQLAEGETENSVIKSGAINTEATPDWMESDCQYLTTAVLKIAYDGTYFSGWTASNLNQHHNKRPVGINESEQKPKRRQSRRSRTLQRKGGYMNKSKGDVRSVEMTLRMALAKIYGNVNPKQIVLDACSRTDAGVHATSSVAQLYCRKGSVNDDGEFTTSTSYRPQSKNDPSFLPLPFESNLSKLVFVLNRMLPPDIRVMAASPLPRNISSATTPTTSILEAYDKFAFHPTLHTSGKTYIYKFAIGGNHDPLWSQYVWHLDGSSGRAVGMNWQKFELERAVSASKIFMSEIPKDFVAFRSAFRGSEKNRVQSTICKIWRCEILHEAEESLPSWEQHRNEGNKSRCDSRLMKSSLHQGSISTTDMMMPVTFTVVITGDRFLYKMVRNIVGSIVAVGCGLIDLDDIRWALDTGSWFDADDSDLQDSLNDDEERRKTNTRKQHTRRICAPPRGLVLHYVHYPENIVFDWKNG